MPVQEIYIYLWMSGCTQWGPRSRKAIGGPGQIPNNNNNKSQTLDTVDKTAVPVGLVQSTHTRQPMIILAIVIDQSERAKELIWPKENNIIGSNCKHWRGKNPGRRPLHHGRRWGSDKRNVSFETGRLPPRKKVSFFYDDDDFSLYYSAKSCRSNSLVLFRLFVLF